MTLYHEIEKLADTPLAELARKAGAGMAGGPGKPWVLRREMDGTVSCVFGRYLDEDFHKQSVGQTNHNRAFCIAALKCIFWDYMLSGHEVVFVSASETLRGKVVCMLPAAKLKEEPMLRIDVAAVQYRVAAHEVRTTIEEMIGIKV